MASRNRSADAGVEAGPDDVSRDRRHEGIEPPRPARVRPVAQGQALGTPEADAG
jgi:hypothetical protein